MAGRKKTQSKTKAKAKPIRKGSKISKKNLKKVSGGQKSRKIGLLQTLSGQ